MMSQQMHRFLNAAGLGESGPEELDEAKKQAPVEQARYCLDLVKGVQARILKLEDELRTRMDASDPARSTGSPSWRWGGALTQVEQARKALKDAEDRLQEAEYLSKE